MHTDDRPVLQFRRTSEAKDSSKLESEVLYQGEPFLKMKEHHLAVAEVVDADPEHAGKYLEYGLISEQRVAKLVDEDIVDNGAYWIKSDANSTPSSVYLGTDEATSAGLPSQVYIDARGVYSPTESTSVETFIGKTNSNVSRIDGVLITKSPIASPTFTGTVSAPNPSTGKTEPVATTEWVTTQVTGNRESKLPSDPTKTGNLYIAGVRATVPSGEDEDQIYYVKSSSMYINSATERLYGAAWNDFAEFEQMDAEYEPGTVVCYTNDMTMTKSTEDLQACPAVVSDSYGMAIGGEGENRCPIAVTGRVRVKYTGPILFGEPVCATEDGKARLMYRTEVRDFPDRILGVICGPIEKDDRVWIKLR